jgi:hypothetical protein
MNKKILVGFVISVIIIAALVVTLFPKKTTNDFDFRDPVVVTSNNLPAYLSDFAVLDDLSKKSKIHLKFGNSLDYTITKGNVERGIPDDPEIIIALPEEYISKLGYGVCGAVQEAVQNGDLEIETSLSKTEILWKYKGLLKHRDCLG